MDDPIRVLRGARVATPEATRVADIVLQRGRVVRVCESRVSAPGEVWEMGGRLVVPGLVDV